MPKAVIDAVIAIVTTGKEAIVKKENGKWMVLESSRRIVYRER